MKQVIDKYFSENKFKPVKWRNEDNIPKVYDVIFNKLPILEDESGEYYGFVGAYYLKENKLDEAMKYLQLAIKVGGDPEAYCNLAKCYELTGNIEEMIKNNLLAIEQNVFEAANNLGCYYKEIKEYEKMEKYLRLALENECYAAALNLGDYYLDHGNIDEGRSLCMTAFENGYKDGVKRLMKYHYDMILHYKNML